MDFAPGLRPSLLAVFGRASGLTTKMRERDNAILISEAHRIHSGKAVELIPTSTAFSELGGQMPLADGFVEALLRRWAEFNNASFTGDPELWEGFETRDPAKIFSVGGPKAT